MKHRRKVTAVAALLVVALLAGAILARKKVEAARGQEATLEEILYLPSGPMLKRMSLGYSGLLANIYWTRAVQYFGERYDTHATRYDLLEPLLDITTDLDPHLVVAYQTGSIFLSQPVPQGAGQPDRAVALLEKGIRENPQEWRMYFTLGFVHYIDRRDSKAAQEAFEKGSEVPGALVWMKVMAARMAERGRDIATATELWKAIYSSNTDQDIRSTALSHLVSLQVDAALDELEARVQTYREKTGALPRTWLDMIRAGVLAGVPLDPYGAPYMLAPDGTVAVQNPDKYMFLGEFRSNKQQQ